MISLFITILPIQAQGFRVYLNNGSYISYSKEEVDSIVFYNETNNDINENIIKYSFETYDIKNNTYAIFYEVTNNQERVDWASGNSAFTFSGCGTSPDVYPTYFTDDSKEGNTALKLETRSTGEWGKNLKKPIAAGNLFLGNFITTTSLTNPLRATRFGKPFALKPETLKGWYKYSPGISFTDKNNDIIADKTDEMDIYAILFDTSNGNEYLTGENIFTSPDIVAIARIENGQSAEEYTEFSIDFDYIQEYDIDKQKNNKYSLTIVFSSSKNGHLFEGATGSTLIIDEVELICSE